MRHVARGGASCGTVGRGAPSAVAVAAVSRTAWSRAAAREAQEREQAQDRSQQRDQERGVDAG